jgi:hypothetical protein
MHAALWSMPAHAQLPFFPGAEGFGGSFTGTPPNAGWFSNATVYHVTNLNDSGPGSFRNAFAQNTSNRIIVFDVAGTIQLGASLDIRNVSNYYVAGQTAPGPVTIYGNTTQITHSNDRLNSNVILRYLTFRKGTGDGEDAITFAGGSGATHMTATNMILDHVSASWSEDEVLSVANNNTNVTVQYSIISDALVNDHAYGSLIRPRIDSNVTFHHNLYAHNSSRQARFGTYNAETLTSDFRNNVIYNWRDRASYAGGSSEPEQEFADINYVGNYLIAGPGTLGNANRAFTVDRNVDARVYQAGNFIDSDRQLNPGGMPNGANTGWGMFGLGSGGDQTLTQMPTPFSTAPVTTQPASDAYRQVLDYVGNHWWSRDTIDTRVVSNVRTNTGPPIGAAAPIASELSAVLGGAMTTRTADWDSDNDGMPGAWESAHGLNPNSPVGTTDWNLDFDDDGYVNLIEYLNEAGEFPAPARIVFSGTSNNRYAQITNWKTDDGGITAGSAWQPSRFDDVKINDGMVVVDAPGQHAGVLTVGVLAGNPATLNITGGWIRVADELVIGAPGATGHVNLSGGELTTGELSAGPFGTFNVTGGTLYADAVNFDLENNGGTIAPGHGISNTQVAGDLTLTSGAVEIELSSPDHADSLLVDGEVVLGGNLHVVPIEGYTPGSGDSWHIVAAGGISGEFASITPGYYVQKQGTNLMLFVGDAPPVVLAGDYNDDGIVDAADYVVWRDSIDSGIPLANETASRGIVDMADYAEWRANFGAAASGERAAVAGPVPEPTSLFLLVAAVGNAAIGLRHRQPRLRISGLFLQKYPLG